MTEKLRMEKCRCGGKPILKGRVDKTVGKTEHHMSIKCVDCGTNVDCCVINDGTVIFSARKLEELAVNIKKMWNAMCTEEEDDDEQSQK